MLLRPSRSATLTPPVKADIQGNSKIRIDIHVDVFFHFYRFLIFQLHDHFRYIETDLLFQGIEVLEITILIFLVSDLFVFGKMFRSTVLGYLEQFAFVLKAKGVHDGVVYHFFTFVVTYEIEVCIFFGILVISIINKTLAVRVDALPVFTNCLRIESFIFHKPMEEGI